MKTYHVTVTYRHEPEFVCPALKAENEREARRMAARIAASCGWRELPHKTTYYETREAA